MAFLLALIISGSLSGVVFAFDPTPLIATATVAIPAASTPTAAIPTIETPHVTASIFSTSTVSATFVSTTGVTVPIVSTPSVIASSISAIPQATSPIFSSATSLSPTQDLIFGTTIEDPFRWLEDGNSIKVKAWVDTQNETARAYLSKLPIRQPLQHRLKDLLKDDEVSVPQEAGGRIFYIRRAANKDKPTVYWHAQGEQEDHVLLKPNAKGEEAVGEWSVSPDGKKLAYQVKKHNSDEAVLHVRNVDNWRESRKDVIAGANFADLSWSEDSKGFYYVGLPTDPTIPPIERVGLATVRHHTLGKSPESDSVVFPETHNSSLYLSPSLSSDGMWLFVSVINGWTSKNIYFREVHDSSSTFKPLFLSTSSTADVTEWGGTLYIKTNDGAPHYRIMQTFIRQPDPSSWKVIVPERADTIIRSMNFVGGYLVLTIMRHAMIGIEVRKADGTLVRTVLEPAPGEIRVIGGQESSDAAYFDFDSVVIPRQIYRLGVQEGTGTLKTWSAPPHPIDDSRYQGNQVAYRSKDGTLVSMFIIERKGLPLDGSVPFLMEGYGGFGVPALFRYDPMIIPWLEAGGGFAVPNVRGGGEYGETWHQAGMLTQKQNTVDDFIAAAEYLIEYKYTSKEHLVIQGVSNGGLLMGAAMTQRPDLFRAVVCKAPLFDMIRYPLFGEGPAWVPEYGSPAVEDQYRALIAYSPYHHIKPGTAYPDALIISPENDDRVDPMHARKMTAALQAAATTYHPTLLVTEPKTGHAGSDSNRSQMDDYVDRLSFLMNAVGLVPSH
jgi:prolyl oligopeptidase